MNCCFEKALLSLHFTLDNPYFLKKNIFSLLFRGRALESLQIEVIQNILIIKQLAFGAISIKFNHLGTRSMVFLILKLAI